jgi:hypothetical protein
MEHNSISETYVSSINHAVVGFQTYLSMRVVIPRYNQKGPEIRDKLLYKMKVSNRCN